METISKVLITPTESGKVINSYESNPEFGYIKLEQTITKPVAGWLKEFKSSTLMKGSIKALQSFVQQNPTLQLSGKLVTKEYTESAVPEEFANQFFNKDLGYEEQIKGYVKRAGKDGPALLSGTERIVRFTVWDSNNSDQDVIIMHTNSEEVKAFNASKSLESAKLPK